MHFLVTKLKSFTSTRCPMLEKDSYQIFFAQHFCYSKRCLIVVVSRMSPKISTAHMRRMRWIVKKVLWHLSTCCILQQRLSSFCKIILRVGPSKSDDDNKDSLFRNPYYVFSYIFWLTCILNGYQIIVRLDADERNRGTACTFWLNESRWGREEDAT